MRIRDVLRVGAVALVLALGCKQSEPPSEQKQAPPQSAASPGVSVTPPRAGTGDPCGPICERTRGLACKNTDACMANCRQLAGVGTCKDEIASVLGCFARAPIAHWECDADGVPSIKQGYCDAEQAKFVACVSQVGRGPAPKAF
jgi:hypothetical protein